MPTGVHCIEQWHKSMWIYTFVQWVNVCVCMRCRYVWLIWGQCGHLYTHVWCGWWVSVVWQVYVNTCVHGRTHTYIAITTHTVRQHSRWQHQRQTESEKRVVHSSRNVPHRTCITSLSCIYSTSWACARHCHVSGECHECQYLCGIHWLRTPEMEF